MANLPASQADQPSDASKPNPAPISARLQDISGGQQLPLSSAGISDSQGCNPFYSTEFNRIKKAMQGERANLLLWVYDSPGKEC